MTLDSAMKPFQDQTFYELLEIPVAASTEEIRSAYERQRELYAPDSVAIYALEDPSQAEAMRARMHEAFEILTDSDLREEYDRIIGLAPPLPRSDRLRDEEEEDRPTQLAMSEMFAHAEAAHSTRPEIAVSYVQPEERDRGSERDRAAERMPERAPERMPERMADRGSAEPEPRRAEERRPEERRVDEGRTEQGSLAEPARAEPEARPLRSTPPAASAGAATGGRALETAPQLAQESAIASAEAALAQVAAKVKEARPPAVKPIEIPADAEFNGELLRRVRESRGLTVSQVAERTRISARHLENIEADRYKDLPVQVYLRGILMNLAREYGLDALRVSRSYLSLTGAKK